MNIAIGVLACLLAYSLLFNWLQWGDLRRVKQLNQDVRTEYRLWLKESRERANAWQERAIAAGWPVIG